ncbi:LysR family transcriptional regulator [Antarctobacter sp.]|uniref:LysR family transcriptional regulator n=1 Tax=Antarctobacter sp. TaxID=1872577 RepID=UPI003A920A17
MDIALIRTFLEVAANGSFAGASDRLFVTQSAVSLRIARLEASLGRALFTRSKAGAELTDAGRHFESYALSLLRTWEEARQQIAVPEGFTTSLSVGAQYSLWARLGFGWLDRFRAMRPDVNLRAELGMPDRLTRYLIEGVIQMGLLYTPHLRPGLAVEKLMDEQLVLVASWPNPDMDLAGRYAFVDWGPEFVQAHALHLPDLTNPGLTLSLGAMSAEYIRQRGLAGYLPARYVARHLDRGELFLVPDAPSFPYPVWTVWREDLPADLRSAAEIALREVAAGLAVEQDQVMTRLEAISEETPTALGSDWSGGGQADEQE